MSFYTFCNGGLQKTESTSSTFFMNYIYYYLKHYQKKHRRIWVDRSRTIVPDVPQWSEYTASYTHIAHANHRTENKLNKCEYIENRFWQTQSNNKKATWSHQFLLFLTTESLLNAVFTIPAYNRCSIRHCLQLFVGWLMVCLHYLCLFAHSGVQHILCFLSCLSSSCVVCA